MSEQPDFATHPRPRRPPARDLGLVGAGVLALLLAGHSAWRARQEAAEARAAAAEARRDLVSLESRIGTASARSAAETALLARAASASDSPPERVVATLAGALPADVRLERLAIAYEEAVSVEMQVVARDAASWDRFLERLDDHASFEGVMPGPERRAGEVRSVVRARFSGGAR